jgi:hypothetical protein
MGSPKHAKRHTYAPSKPFGAWVLAIARYKWIDRVRDASRYAALSLDDDIPIEDQGGAAVNAVTLDHLLGRLKPAQESVIRLVKQPQRRACIWRNRPIRAARQGQYPSRSKKVDCLGFLKSFGQPHSSIAPRIGGWTLRRPARPVMSHLWNDAEI